MIFPPYELANYQISHAARAEYFMGASAPQAISLQQLLSLADQQELEQWNNLTLGYSTSQGDPTLRESIAGSYPGLTAANIITFAGAQEAIFVAYHALLNAQDRVQVILPIFEPLARVAQAIGARVDRVRLRLTENHTWQLDMDQWRESIDDKTAMAVINFPHNPTGKRISHDELQLIVDHCDRNNCWLFSDEVFRGLEYRQADQLPPVASVYAKGISLGVMSKAYGLGGVRVGWIATQDERLIKRMLEIKHYLSICNGRTDEQLALIALQHAPQLMQSTHQLIRDNLQRLTTTIESISGIQWSQTDAGCVAYPRLLDGASSRLFAKKLLDQTAVMIIPGDCFMWGDAHFRIGFGRRDFPQALDRFATYMQSCC